MQFFSDFGLQAGKLSRTNALGVKNILSSCASHAVVDSRDSQDKDEFIVADSAEFPKKRQGNDASFQ